MGCGGSIRVLPIMAQRAIKAKQEGKTFILSISQFDQNYDWYCTTCQKLEHSSLKTLTLNFDSKVPLKSAAEETIVDALLRLLNTLSLQDLVLSGKLDIFNNPKWKEYWKTSTAQMISIQDRLRTQGFINFMRHHAENPNTRSLIIKRDFTLNDIFYMCYHLLKNRTVRNLHLSFVETGVENNSNLLTPVTMAMPMKKKEPQILVTADRMDVTTNMFQPLSVLAHNTTVESLTLSGYMPSEMGDYLVNGLSLNSKITQLSLMNFTFPKASIKSWVLAFAVNTSLTSVTITFGMNDESASVFFHALKYSKSLQNLRIENAKFSAEGFQQLANCVQSCRSLQTLALVDLDNLGASTDNPMEQCENLTKVMLALGESQSLTKVAIKLNVSSLNAAVENAVFTDRSDDLCMAIENALSKNNSITDLDLVNLRFADRLIDAVGRGLRTNKKLRSLNMSGNLMEWKDLAGLSESLVQNNTLETLDLQNNRIGKVRDMKVSKGFDMSETLRQIRSCFKYLKEIKKVESLLINDWLFDDLEYPDNVADCIKETRVQIQDKTAFATISSTKRGT